MVLRRFPVSYTHLYVACMRENSAKSGITSDFFEHNGAKCYNIDVPNIGPARAIAYDIAALNKAIEIAKENNDQAPIFYVLACRIGPFISGIKKKIKAIGGTLMAVSYTHLIRLIHLLRYFLSLL